jgi:predicted RNA binding protein YcfA (HicA-like mRNA interferase family)
MPKNTATWKQGYDVLKQLGYQLVRIRGSHRIYARPEGGAPIPVPRHEMLAIGTFQSILRMAGIGRDEFFQRARQSLVSKPVRFDVPESPSVNR